MIEKNSGAVTVFHGRRLPEPGTVVGYGALWRKYELPVPLPARLAVIAEKHHRREDSAWLVLTPRNRPDETLGGHLEFALKWEGVDLAILRWLFRAVSAGEVAAVIRATPTGAYARRIWFLYEWLTGDRLDLPDSGKVKAVLVLDPKHHYAAEKGVPSSA